MKKATGVFGLLIVVCLITVILNPLFLGETNLYNSMRWTAEFGIISIGVVFVIVTGGIDLSIGSLIALVGTIMAWLLQKSGWDPASTIALVLCLSALLGLAHGMLITKMRLQPFVVTLCGLLLYRGIARYIAGTESLQWQTNKFDGLREIALGKPFSLPVPFIKWISEGNWGTEKWNYATNQLAVNEAGQPIPLDVIGWIPVPMPMIILLVLAVIAAIFLNKTIYGRYLIALGNNEEAAKYSGINTDRMKLIAYTICGFMGGIGGIVFTLELPAAQPASMGSFYELYAIAAAVLGGCSLRGGEASILGVFIAAALIRIILNATNILGIPSDLDFAVVGAVLLLGVSGDEIFKRYAAKRAARQQDAE